MDEHGRTGSGIAARTDAREPAKYEAQTDVTRGAKTTRFTLQGRLRGMLGPGFSEPLAGAKVRLYRSRQAQEVIVARAAAPAKDTLAILTDEEVATKAADLLGEATIDESGRFEVTLGLKEHYGGEAFDVDVYCGNVPHHLPPPKPQAVQFAVTTLQPRWRQSDTRGATAAFEQDIPSRFWCGIRSKFGAWVVFGTVTAGASNTPVPNVRVRAFDVDWLQDDAIGSSMTDAAGQYRVDYVTDDFTATAIPFIRLEWVSGPDLYFKVETGGGTTLLQEPSSRGRAPDRENVGQCKLVDLHLQDAPVDQGGTETHPMTVFYEIGRYNVSTQIDSAPTGSGRTVYPANPALANRAFFADLPLRGVLGQKMPLSNDPLEYRFEFAEYPSGSTVEPPDAAFTPVLPGMIDETQIGTLQLFDPGAPDPSLILVNKRVLVNGPPGAPPPGADYVKADIVGGWIRVPQNDNINAAAGGLFVPDVELANLRSTSLATFETVDCTQLEAGEAAQSEGRVVPREHFFAIRLKVRTWGVAASEQPAGHVRRVAVSNPTYTNITRHAEWNPAPPFSAFAVVMLDVAELVGAGCTKVTNSLQPRFTAAHPNMGGVTMRLEGGPTPAKPFTVPASPSSEDQFGVGVPNGWGLPLTPCSYLVRVSADVNVTTGTWEPPGIEDYMGFCT